MPDEQVRTFREIRDTGLLWLINTSVLHPRGYALGISWADGADPETDEPIGWTLYGDGTEPWRFADAYDVGVPEHRTLDAMFARVNELLP